jgi:hypothetical protein
VRTRIATLVAAAMAATVLVAGPVSAGDSAVVITLDVNFVKGTEKFTATGSFCPAGSAETTSFALSGRVFHVEKTFRCKDRSGTLSITLDAAGSSTGTSGGWSIVGGTGAYAGATGGGHIVGVSTPTGILDTYTGSINR